jgi:hypothetical protein
VSGVGGSSARVDTVDALVRGVLDRAAARRDRQSAQRNPARKRPVKEPDRKDRKPIREPGKPPKPMREPSGRDDGSNQDSS